MNIHVDTLDYVVERPQKLKVRPMQLTSGDKRLMKDQYLQRRREAQDQDEMRECTFTPQLNPRSIQIIESQGPRESIEYKASKLQKLKKDRLKYMQELYLMKEQKRQDEECTFKPKIS